MKRRDFLGAAALGVALPAAALDGPPIRWRLTTSFPRSNEVIWKATEKLAERVATATGGRFQIQSFGPGELVPALGALDAVSTGTVQIAVSSSFYYIGKDPTFAFDTCVPFGMNSRQQTAWMMEGGGLGLMRALFHDYSIYNIPFGNTGTLMGGWFRHEIHGVQDLKGLKFRISGLAGQVLAKLGVTPQVIPAADTYPALERGTIDAAKLSGPYDDEKMGFNRVAKYYYYPGWAEGGLQPTLMINLKEWQALPPAYQAIVETACIGGMGEFQAGYDAANAAACGRLVAAGTQLRHFPQDVLQAAWRATLELNEEIAERNPRYREVYDHWRRFRDRQIAWFGVAERPFDNFMAGRMR